jgi:hypothetical protein
MTSLISMLLLQGIYAGAISAISSLTLKSCGTIKKLYENKNPDVNKIISDLDVEKKLKIIQAYISKVNPNYESLENLDTMILIKQPEDLCLKYIHLSIKNIYNILNEINIKIEKHQKKWFQKWRKLNVTSLLDELKIQFKILDDRFDYFVKIYGRKEITF